MTLPIGLSVPHAGVQAPASLVENCLLTPEQIARDGDEGASEIFDLSGRVTRFLTTDIARAFVDLNRPVDDRGSDGVVKTETIYQEPIYRQPLGDSQIETLLQEHYYPYHAELSNWANAGLKFAVDGHTMAAVAPPIGPNPGSARPEICLGDVDGLTFPTAWMDLLHTAVQKRFAGFQVTRNSPFRGGHITRLHGTEMPWVQIEVSRSEFLPAEEIRARLFDALAELCDHVPAAGR